jgi:hypothetical protein
MARLSGIPLPFRASSQSNITVATEAPWTLLGPGREVLSLELEELYWEGVRGELENIIWTLKTWQKPDFSNVTVAHEEDDFVHGFDTFIGQVTEESRAFAIRYGAAQLPNVPVMSDDLGMLISGQERKRNTRGGSSI